jgi:protein gp37
MSDTLIQWTDKVWNPTRGCSVISSGCTNCYAMKQAHRFSGHGQPYDGLTRLGANGPIWTGEVRTVPEMLDAPLRWKKSCRVFVDSMSDLFHEDVPDEFIAAVFGVMQACPDHTFQVLTKRAVRLPDWFNWVEKSRRGYWHGTAGLLMDCLNKHGKAIYEMAKAGFKRATRLRWPDMPDPVTSLGDSSLGPDWPLPNVWIGVSTEDQKAADGRIPHLLKTPAAVRFLSVEPLLGPIDLRFEEWQQDGPDESPYHAVTAAGQGISWVIVGGESGPNARPCDLAWIRSIVRQCQSAGVHPFVKQIGSRPFDSDAMKSVPDSNRKMTIDEAKSPAGLFGLAMCLEASVVEITDSKGGNIEEFPPELRIQEFPTTEAAHAPD